MNKYLAKLHSLQYGSGAPNPETRHPKLPSKPSKPSFEGFEGDQGRGLFENGEDAATVDPCAKHMAEDAKNITPQYLQNFQNLGSPSGPAVSPGCSVTIIELPHYRAAAGAALSQDVRCVADEAPGPGPS